MTSAMRTLNFALRPDEFKKSSRILCHAVPKCLSLLGTMQFQILDCCSITKECNRYLLSIRVVFVLPRNGVGGIDILFDVTNKNFTSFKSISFPIILLLVVFFEIFGMTFLDEIRLTTTRAVVRFSWSENCRLLNL